MTRHGLMMSTFAAALLAGGVLAGTHAARAVDGVVVDHPGQIYQIDPDHLPPTPPYGRYGAFPKKIPRPAGALPEVPEGFSVNLYADGLTYVRWLAVAPNGDLFASEPDKDAGKITILRDSKGTGKADQKFTFSNTFFDHPHGVAFHNGYLYVGDLKGIWRMPYKTGMTSMTGTPERVTSKVVDLRPGPGHDMRDFAFGEDGTIYLGVGARDNVSDFKPGAQVFKVNKDGSMSEFASGIRNAVGIAVQPGTNNLYVAVNERDGLGDQLPPEYMTLVKQGDFFGYPYAFIGKHPDPVWAAKDPGGMIAKSKTPDVIIQAHSAPTGLTFYTGKQFPKEYWGDAFVSLHGSVHSNQPTGYKVIRVHFVKGKPQNSYENFLTGFWDGAGNNKPGSLPQVWGRPVGIAVAKDGSLLIADDQENVVWRVAYTGKK